ncbi:MAG TPA: PPC domain-containing protein [Blastocatellia bacterium]|nr:PPC domain-containing protein [Blastocatellia bacterium]
MTRHRSGIRWSLMSIALAALTTLACSWAYAGGPLIVNNGHAVRWSRVEVRGGPLNSQTVDQSGRVLYRVDSGPLGPLNNTHAAALVDRIFKLYTDIPTADIEFLNAGSILDPTTGNPADVNGTNVGKFLSGKNPTFQNPIIFDSDGSITGGGGVLGFFGFLQTDDPLSPSELREGFVVLNGSPLTRRTISTTSFLGVFTHEFGHFAGPLDHAQINGNIASNGKGSILPSGFTEAQAFDLYAPFTETLFPFIFDGPRGSQLADQFKDSGFFVATLDLDTQNALSNLYPAPDYLASRGSLEGRVLFKLGATEIPISGINVIARRIDQGAYPPPEGTTAFPSAPTVDSDGVPQLPPAQGATDSLATVASAVTGLDFGSGTYRIQGLPAGQYLVEIQQINPDAIAGSGIGPLRNPFTLPVKEEFFNGSENSSNSSSVFMPVTVSAGQLTSGIDLIINGVSTGPPALVDEREPNDKTKKAQRLEIPAEVSASAADTDDSLLRMSLPDGSRDPIEDLYRITVDQTRIVFIILEATSGSGDLDLYLFTSGVSKKRSSLDDPNLLTFSTGPTANEFIGFQLDPGDYFIGVSAFSGNLNYKLRMVASQ